MNQLIPANEFAQFMQLPVDVRTDIQAWMEELAAVTKPIQKSLAAVATRMGVSLKTARRKYDNWRITRHWRTLVNRAKVPEERSLSPEFIEYWKGLCSGNSRKIAPAYRDFVRAFKARAMIPGIDPTISRKRIPLGYGYDNLLRYAPTEFELTAARIGRSAAAAFRPKVFTSRKDLSVGQHYIFDDMWHDFEVVMINQRKAMRLLQLHAHDLFSGCQFARGLKPRIKDELTGKSVNLNENEMIFLVANVLSEFGYHPDGCVLMVEHGTAAINEDLEKQLFDLTAGRVTVDRSGMGGASSFAGQYAGQAKGNFRFKAALESLGNLIHNETANLLQFPGQTGSNSRINRPEELHGRERHFEALAKAMVALPADRAAMLRLPFLEFHQAVWAVEEIMERINQRTDHNLEGWIDAGLTTMDFDIPGVGIMPAQDFLALSADKQIALKTIAAPVPRKMSPREVFNNGRRRLVELRPEITASILHRVAGREERVGDDHLITFEDQNISSEPLRYLAHHFRPGDKFDVVVNPMSPETAHLFDARGGWVGVVKSWQAVSPVDAEALHRQMGAAAKIESQLLKPLAKRGAEITRKRLEDSQHNAEVLNTKRAFTPAEKSTAKLVKEKGAAAAEDFLTSDAPAEPASETPVGDFLDQF